MKFVRKYIDRVLKKDETPKKRTTKTERYAVEVTEKYKKTLRKLAHE